MDNCLMSEIITQHAEGLTPGQEAFLFGDQGEILDREVAQDVFHTKLGLSLLWLSSYWPTPYPEEVVAAEYTARSASEEMIIKWTAEGIFDPNNPKDQVWLEMTKPKNPILHALQLEWRFQDGAQTAIEERSVLTTALAYTNETLGISPETNAKLSYVVELIEHHDQNIHARETASPWEEPPILVFPDTPKTYMLGTFPMHEMNLDLY